MSQVTSGLKIEKIDGNNVIIRTQTTYDENNSNSPSSVKETQLVVIDEDVYNSLMSIYKAELTKVVSSLLLKKLLAIVTAHLMKFTLIV